MGPKAGKEGEQINPPGTKGVWVRSVVPTCERVSLLGSQAVSMSRKLLLDVHQNKRQ